MNVRQRRHRMESISSASTRRTIAAAAALAAGLTAGPPAAFPAPAGEAMPAAQQVALVKKQCVVCHNDAQRQGLLSLEHFDAAHPDPSLTAMLVSKLTGGLSPTQVEAAQHDQVIAALVAGRMKSGAMGAAGLGVPDSATQDGLLRALSASSVGASGWSVNQTHDPATQAPILTASILRETPSTIRAEDTDMYRLTLTCRGAHEAEMLLTWANGAPAEGRPFTVAVDGQAPLTFTAEGGEKQGNGKGGPGGVVLHPASGNAGAISLPARTLTISNVFPDETVVFPFGDLTRTVKQVFSTCFSGSRASR
jgi:hypothetical protein